MNDEILGFDDKYVTPSETVASSHEISTSHIPSDSIDKPDFSDEVKTIKYGIGKPRRIVIRGKISE